MIKDPKWDMIEMSDIKKYKWQFQKTTDEYYSAKFWPYEIWFWNEDWEIELWENSDSCTDEVWYYIIDKIDNK